MPDKFTIAGRFDYEELEQLPKPPQLKALALDSQHQILGSARVDDNGKFSIPVRLDEPRPVRVVLGPDRPDREVRKTSTLIRDFPAEAWKKSQNRFRLEVLLRPEPELLIRWLPKRVCVSGQVRKSDEATGGGTTFCPVPFVKVEIFDVDREGCWWPYLEPRLPELFDRPALRIPDLLSPKPLPEPRPLPVPPEPFPLPPPIPRPDPPPFDGLRAERPPLALERPSPGRSISAAAEATAETQLVGEVSSLAPEVRDRVSRLTLTSHEAPWVLIPHCFYSQAKICETTTDEEGRFDCCFDWWPIHLRRGRLRFDWRPDVIVRVTQVINGVEEVLYLDPYTSTRWNASNAHIDLCLDDPRIECGDGDPQERPEGSQAFFTRVGSADEVFKIAQTTGLYAHGGITNAAYGRVLRLHGQFGDALSSGGRYYRLSFRPKHGGTPKAIDHTLNDVRVNKLTNFSETHKLGPHTVGGEPSLYEVRDFQHYLWYHPDLIGVWDTRFEDDEGTYVLRLEVFDSAGNRLGQAIVDYLDGTQDPGGELPSTGQDWADLVLHLDNKAPTAELDELNVTDPTCGIIPWSPGLVFQLQVDIVQENGRLHDWGLSWRKGVSGDRRAIQGARPLASADGSPASIHQVLPGVDADSSQSLTAGLTGSCAFSFHLWATAHVRDGDGWLKYAQRATDDIAVAVEKCS